MALFTQRPVRARSGRPLHLDRLEQRQLLSVNAPAPNYDSLLPQGQLPKLGDTLSDVVQSYRAFTQANPGQAYQLFAGSPLQQRNQLLSVEAVAVNDADALVKDLILLGAQNISAYGRYVDAWIPISKLDKLSGLDSLQFAYGINQTKTNVGLTTSQADISHRTNLARPQYAVDGTGVTVGVLSDSFDSLGTASIDRASGDLPLDIQVLDDLPPNEGSDEGRAMLQLINDLAPGASLAFASAFTGGQANFANNIQRLANEANADVIVDDVIFFAEPMFQDGIIAQAVDAVKAQGVVYFSSSGNGGTSSYEDSFWTSTRSFYPADPNDDFTASQFVGQPDEGTIDASEEDDPFHPREFFLGGDLLTFAGLDDLQEVTIPEGSGWQAILQWDQPYFSLTGQAPLVDLDFYLLNEDGDQVVAASTNTQVDRLGNPTGFDPFEILSFVNFTDDSVDGDTFNVVIVKRYAETQRTFYWDNSSLIIPDDGETATSINVDVPGLIRDIDVTINLTHPSNSDLVITLVAPDGDTDIEMISDVGGSGFINTTLDDNAGASIEAGASPYTGRFRPVNSLNDDLQGTPATGTWTLLIEDTEGNNLSGLLRDWSITVRTDHNPQDDPGLLKYVLFGGAEPNEYFFGSSTLYGHTNAAGANSVGAVPYFLAEGFGDNEIALEPFSAEGDVPILFDTSGIRLASPENRVKPDILGIDGTNTTFFSFGSDIEGDGFFNFFGTSAAAPHVAAIAALMLQAVPDATPDEIQTALQNSALPVPFSNGGLAQADLAIGLLALNRVGSISGVKFNDLNRDGFRQDGEPPLPGFQVFLDQNNNGVPDEAQADLDSNRVPIKIFDNTTITSEIFALGIPNVIKDVSVQVDIDHTAVGDLTLTLISPEGTRVQLASAIGGAGDNFRNTIFGTGAQFPLITAGQAPFTGTFRPQQSLEILDGEKSNGVWRLEVRDAKGFNVGTLKNWSLQITYDEPVATADSDGDYRFSDLPLGAYRVTDLVDDNPGWSSSDPGNQGRPSPVLFTEIDPGNVDAFELINFSHEDQNTAGWSVVISDSPYGDINEVNSTVWALPSVVRDGQVIIATDSPSNNYFGTNIFWNRNNTRIGSGWAMLVDDQGYVRDWVGWGWDAADLASFNITVPSLEFNGAPLHVVGLDGIWNGGAVERSGDGTIQRRGTQDRNVSTDFIWYNVPSIGAMNVSPRPDFIIGDDTSGAGGLPVFVRAGEHVMGIDIGDQYTGLPAVQISTPDGPVQGPISSVSFQFTEPMDPNSFSLDDILGFTGPNQRVLDEFLAQPNPDYQWSLNSTFAGVGFTGYVLDFTSQSWRTADEVSEPIWHHWLTILVPDVVQSDTALLLVDGGSRFSGPPNLSDGDIQQLAQFVAATGTVAVHLPNVPNQPLRFPNDALTTGNRSEDEIIASSFEMAIRTGDPTWAALLPMVRSAVKAMDAAQEFTSRLADSVTLQQFVVTGASKRGWTTWLTGAVDPRVKAIMPMVFDALNLEPQFDYHGQVYSNNPFFTLPSQQDPSRQFSEAIEDYVHYEIVDIVGLPIADYLAQIVDPYTFRDRLDLPKYDVVSAGDEFFLNDSSQFYFDALPGPRYLRYVPNTGHGLNQSAVESMVTFYQAILDGDTLPQFSWTFLADGSIQVQTGPGALDVPTTVRLWQANNPNFQDFRNGFGAGPTWTSTVLASNGSGGYLGQVSNPLPGWTAFLVELTYDVGEAAPLVFTTEVRLLNDGAPLDRANTGSDTDGGAPVPLDPATVDLLDQITGFQWSDDGLTLTIFFQAQSAEGNYQLTIAPGITDQDGNPLDQNQDGVGGQSVLDEYTASFDTRSSISGTRFSDINGDGIRQVDEPGLAGLRVYLDLDGDGTRDEDEPTTLTDDQGNFNFALLSSATYFVAIELRPGFTPTSPPSGRQAVPLGQSQARTGVVFGERPSGTTWQPQGPSPILSGQVEGLEEQNNPVAGAIQTVAAHPTNANVLYVGTVNGGIWKTTNATSANPVWTPQTDEQDSLSIGALEFDPTDASFNTLVAGIGRYSSLAGDGGPRTGLLRTTNGGNTWQELGQADLTGKNISGLAARGSVITVGVDRSTDGPVGLYRSTDGGQTFVLISGSVLSALPSGPITDLVGDKSNAQRLYAGVQGVGLFRSDDAGATWTNITSGVTGIGVDTDKIEFAVHASAGFNAVYVAVINDGQLDGVYRSGNQGGTWQRMDLPVTNEGGELVGVNPEESEERPGGQGSIHFSIVADPLHPFVVFVGGDRQPDPFPNSIGAEDYSGRLFRGDASKLPGIGAQWRPVTHDFAQGSAPHADSREMVFAADNTLIQTDDGGIYRLLNATSNSTDIVWRSLNGNLQITEFHSVDFDANSRTITGGTQDVGTVQQGTEDASRWRQAPVLPISDFLFIFPVAGGDGGVVAIDDSDPTQSVRYGSSQFLGGFARQYYNSANTLIDTQFPDLVVQGTGGRTIYQVDPPQFYTPLVLNSVNPLQMVIGTQTHVFESFNQGDTLVDLGSLGPIGALAYGGSTEDPQNPGELIPNSAVLYVGAGADLFLRSTAGGALVNRAAYPGGDITDIVLDPYDWRKVYVIDGTSVYRSLDAGLSWSNVSGNLNVGNLRTIEFARFEDTAVLLVGGDRGVALSLPSVAGNWSEVGNLPNAPVTDLRYDSRADYLLAGTLGRGAWSIVDFLYQLGANRQPQAAADADAFAGTGGLATLSGPGPGGQSGLANANPQGGLAWYSFQGSSTGQLSLAALAGVAGSSVQLSVFDSQMRLLANPTGGAGSQQVNLAVQAGKTYYVQVGGTAPGVSLTLASPGTQSGKQLTIQGTPGDDQFSFSAGATLEVTLNGLTYSYSRSEVESIIFVSAGGRDTATLTGSSSADTATLAPGKSRLAGPGYQVEVQQVHTVVVHGGGGQDQAQLGDSSGNDVLTARPGDSLLTGDNFSLQAKGFLSARATASSGFDQANLFDSAGDDQFTGRPNLAQIAGANYFVAASGFDSVRAYGSTGSDTAVLYDSTGDDQFIARPTYSQLSGTGYSNYVKGFDSVRAQASSGQDSASLYDSAGDDQLVGRVDFSQMTGAGYFYLARGFDAVRSYASTGYDTAALYDSPGDDQFIARPDYTQVTGAGYLNYAKAFDEVRSVSTGGKDSADLFGSGGTDQYMARPDFAQLAGPGYFNSVRSFATVRAYSSGGQDQATLFGAASDDVLELDQGKAQLTSGGYAQSLSGFASLQAYSGGGDSRAQVVDAALEVSLAAGNPRAQVSNDQAMIYLYNFRRLSTEQATQVRVGSQKVSAGDFLFSDDGDWLEL